MADFESTGIFIPSITVDNKIVSQYTLILLLGNLHRGEEFH